MHSLRPAPELPLPEDAVQDYGGAEPSRGATVLEWASLVLVAAARRKRLAVAVFLLGFGAAVTYFVQRTPLYRVEAKILAQRMLALPSIVQRSVIDEEPTRSARELIHRRDNLLNLIKQANLPVEPPVKVGEPNLGLRVGASWFPGASLGEQDPLNALAVELDKSFLVTTDENTITIRIDWPHPEQAYHLVESAQQNFLEARHVQEITALGEIISALQVRVASLREQLESVTEEVRRELSRGSVAARGATTRPAESDEEVVRLKSALDSKERALRDLEEMRRRRLGELQAQLAQMLGVYSEEFPGIVSLRQEIAAMSSESPQIAAVRAEEAKLRGDYNARVAEIRRQQAVTAGGAVPTRSIEGLRLEEDERVLEARAQYQQMLDRLIASQVDFDTARSAFKHRYKVIWPAQTPKAPISPDPLKVLGLGMLGALMLALLAAASPDLLSGLLLQRWQLERGLGLPILATARRSGSAASGPDVRRGLILHSWQLEKKLSLPLLAELRRTRR
ncbi:MAG: lipopolysaccharide biosynthesis protein [Myxococcaceae bacterium]|nr:lipopolysaccharide biosynthesis protein [Myxococcaceae bacterium]MCI0670088.1 lipopolysaccharide biosynthesis protein [Myxococcaceae bacterium]